MFERMYKSFEDPWHQSGENYYASLYRRNVCYYLERFGIDSIVEWCCGLGNTSSYIKENTRRDVEILGVDISETAVKKASKFHPEIEFRADNILNIENY